MPLPEAACKHCHATFTPSRAWQTFCTKSCHSSFHAGLRQSSASWKTRAEEAEKQLLRAQEELVGREKEIKNLEKKLAKLQEAKA